MYPQHHTVSFTLVAKKHIEYMMKDPFSIVHEMDELSFPSFRPSLKYLTILHPWIFIFHRVIQYYDKIVTSSLRDRIPYYLDLFLKQFDKLIAVDVCDSDRMSDYAVNLLNYADKIIVPSSFCKQVYESSGVKKHVIRIPHGVDPEWFTTPNVWEISSVKDINPILLELFLYKTVKRKKILLFYLWHSPERKGWIEVRQAYEILTRERKDVVLVLKTYSPNSPAFQEVMHLGAIQVYGWLNDYEKMALYDISDVTLNFSRGGSFEINCLESLVRGIPCIGHERGSWIDYLPDFLRVKINEKVKVFNDNVIHVGYGYKIDVEDAVDKIHDILDNYDDYKAKLEEWRQKVLYNEYRWDLIAKKLFETINN